MLIIINTCLSSAEVRTTVASLYLNHMYSRGDGGNQPLQSHRNLLRKGLEEIGYISVIHGRPQGGAKRAFPTLEIRIKSQNFLENLKSAA